MYDTYNRRRATRDTNAGTDGTPPAANGTEEASATDKKPATAATVAGVATVTTAQILAKLDQMDKKRMIHMYISIGALALVLGAMFMRKK